MNTPPSAIITGGSAGLGRAIARTLALAGYDITVTGRDATRLQQLGAENPSWKTFAGDATSADDAARMIQQHVGTFGGLDVLVNVVGQSDRGRIDGLDPDRLRELLDANVISTLVCSQAALPSLQQRQGVIVNIGSLAGRVAPAYLGGYVAAKHALSGLTRQMRLEVRSTGVHVGLICPGPIARDDAGDRYDVSSHEGVPASAGAPGGGAKLKGLAPDVVAEAVLRCIRRRQTEVIMPWKVRALMAIDALCPSLADQLLSSKTST